MASVLPAQLKPLSRVAALPTGAKLLLILSVALLPLALIAIGATLQVTRLADDQSRARLRVAADESAHALAIELAGDMTALRAAVDALAADPANAPGCARVQGAFAQQAALGTRFLIEDRRGRRLCGDPLPIPAARAARGRAIDAAVVPGRGVVLSFVGTHGERASTFFPARFLARIATPSSRAVTFGSELGEGGDRLVLMEMPQLDPFDRVQRQEVDLGIGGLVLRTSAPTPPISSSLIVALLLPLMMWAAAAGISWFVVDRLLIRPLRQLRANVAAFTPGEVIDPGTARQMPAQEIRELGDTFRAISRTVALHEAGLAEGLVRQTKLTREVHHRVKNNLQVIASLINFHARGAPSPDAAAAYASIQRRVDALAVVHRNHYAEMEVNRGLNLRTMIGELASSLRASAPERSGGLGITLEVEPLLVSQDTAVALAFIVTETIELAMTVDPAAQIRIAGRQTDDGGRGVLRVVSRALVEGDRLRELVATRYGRVTEGLARQLRAPLHHDPLTGAYEIGFAVTGRD